MPPTALNGQFAKKLDRLVSRMKSVGEKSSSPVQEAAQAPARITSHYGSRPRSILRNSVSVTSPPTTTSSTTPKPKSHWKRSPTKGRAPAPPIKPAEPEEPSRGEQMYALLIDGNYECLICSDEIEPRTPIWSCAQCHHAYHTTCAASWSAKSKSSPNWACPTCKTTYHSSPTSTCWCGKTHFDEITGVANSCGQPCLTLSECAGRMQCLAFCDMPCHPGPCKKVVCIKECRDLRSVEEEMGRVRAVEVRLEREEKEVRERWEAEGRAREEERARRDERKRVRALEEEEKRRWRREKERREQMEMERLARVVARY